MHASNVRCMSATASLSPTPPKYTMVKKNWFNGVNMPAIVIRELDGTLRVAREFGYEDYASSLS